MAPRRESFHNGRMMMSPEKKAQREYVQRVLDALGLKPSQLARKAKIDPSTLTRFMNNPVYKHNLSATNLQKIEAVSGIKAPIPTPISTTPLPEVANLRTVKVRGIAAAGLWKDVTILDNDLDHEEIPVVEDPRYAGRTQYAVLVEGESVNRKIRDGEYAICVAWDELGIEFQDGQYVHLERYRGGLREVTVKQLRIVEGQLQAWPDSDDARFQEPLDLAHTDEDTEVRVRGLVIGRFSHFK